MSVILQGLYNELAKLDEQAGCFDEVTNARIERQRRKLMIQALELEVAELDSIKLIKQTRTMETA